MNFIYVVLIYNTLIEFHLISRIALKLESSQMKGLHYMCVYSLVMIVIAGFQIAITLEKLIYLGTIS